MGESSSWKYLCKWTSHAGGACEPPARGWKGESLSDVGEEPARMDLQVFSISARDPYFQFWGMDLPES